MEGLAGTTMFLWALSALSFGMYAVAQNFNIPLQIQLQDFMCLCLVTEQAATGLTSREFAGGISTPLGGVRESCMELNTCE
ncbi:hypothetical protein VTK56DRAFT_2115 [Thermocarpiscus australiensis]